MTTLSTADLDHLRQRREFYWTVYEQSSLLSCSHLPPHPTSIQYTAPSLSAGASTLSLLPSPASLVPSKYSLSLLAFTLAPKCAQPWAERKGDEGERKGRKKAGVRGEKLPPWLYNTLNPSFLNTLPFPSHPHFSNGLISLELSEQTCS